MANTHDKVINIALNEVGYLEKKSNAHLESKTENAGYANYTKYGKWYGLNPAYWCAMFLCWIFHEAYGTNAAKQLLAGKFSAACEDIRQNFISRKQYITSGPKAGDIVFYTGSRHAGANHIGLIVEVSNGKIYTVEGNTSGGSSVIKATPLLITKSWATEGQITTTPPWQIHLPKIICLRQMLLAAAILHQRIRLHIPEDNLSWTSNL